MKQLTIEDIRSFQIAYEDDYGIILTLEEAFIAATQLLSFFVALSDNDS